MFKRPHSTKPSNAISSSARKKLINQLTTTTTTTTIKQETINQLIPTNGITISRAYSHLNEQLSIYYDPEHQPIYIQLNTTLIPTIYTLLRYPSLLPTLRTNQLVLDKLVQGADLMLPGLNKSNLDQLTHLKKDQLVSISGSNPEDPIWAVGFLADDVTSLIRSESGKAVITIHTQNDFLWNAGSKRIPARLEEPSSLEEPEPSAQLENLTLDQESPAPNETQKSEPTTVQTVVKPPVDHVDEFLHSALLMTLWKGDKLEALLPMPASLFYSDHILPARPIECPKAVGVKDSSAKSLAKWVKLAQKKGFLTAKEERKGAETMVVGINLSHPELKKFAKFRTIGDQEKEESKQQQQQKKTQEEGGESKRAASWSLPETSIEQLYRAKTEAGVKGWIGETDLDAEALHTRHAIKEALARYLNARVVHPPDRATPLNRGLVRPDPTLAQALLGPSPTSPISRNQLFEILLAQAFDPWWRLTRNNLLVAEKRGDLPTIVLKMKKKAGPKQATLLTGTELFGIDPFRLAKELKVICAGSTTTHPIPANHPTTTALKPLSNRDLLGKLTADFMPPTHQAFYGSNQAAFVEVECQGDQREFLSRFLVADLGVPKAFVVVV
ncbi:uncharacterized protein PGTG_12916 [Puccinia graminis f. sp. tritici CRL 75-36-700-3]|uniref:SUI1 domain-containing protein n=1 Tax=Puccinia graminis f. sp. tritici (strain CRL 75-36-700-3 / race SCCL) TaxID=418459 RepID=E3KSP6_PUCGT|nr:uncharacterized protein PGTG_12916 [Puccinia graminis f. sp. tritici CRL 75-36-700-3]EFP87332.2 hypothetical protein PGTG_12916 [Puccinia graminis f. sp. tritici CRL 75-36-700-3]